MDALHIAGIGASAGGLEALQKMLPGLPPGIGLAYVVVQHLAANHASALAELLAKWTKMPVEEVQDGVTVKADTIYVAPPGKDILLVHDKLRLREVDHPSPKPSIDYFFESLAEHKGHLAIGIVLSGAGDDGTHGVRAIKAANGITISQTAESAEFPGMADSANGSDSIDLCLAPQEIGPTLAAIVTVTQYPARAEDGKAQEEVLHAILRHLHKTAQTDFSQYRPTTLFRRISRRAMLNRISSLDDYLDFLRKQPGEVELLQKDLLITVTRFFRDREAFSALSKTLGETLRHKRPNDLIRVWVPACATGEEAYSIAIVLCELLGDNLKRLRVQIFATDLDEEAVQCARKSVYPVAAVMEEDQTLVDRYFTRVDNMMAVNRELRDMVIWARHDLIQDIPFLHLDLISCRNLLIYLESDLQKKLLSLFHFSLNRDGVLFLGKSESVSRRQELFQSLDVKWKIFRKKETMVNNLPALLQRRRHLQTSPAATPGPRVEKSEIWKEREFASALLAILDCSAIQTDAQGNIAYIRGDVSRYLRLPEGSVRENLNAVHMARKEVRFELESVLKRARNEPGATVSQDVRFERDGSVHIVRIAAGQVGSSPEPQFLLVFHHVVTFQAPGETRYGDLAANDENGRIAELEVELAMTRDQLQEAVEELETSSEELQSLNEELQASNEELQASNEELGSTNEELQASNEELYTVNEELRVKSFDLVQAMAQLEEREKRYKQLVQNANSAIVGWRADGTITFFNEYAQRLFGYRAEEIIGESVGILVPPQDSHGHDLQELVRDIVANPAKYENNVNENICRNGKRLWMTWTNRAIFDEWNRVVEILAVGSDITPLKKVEAQLRKHAKDLRESQKIAGLGSWRLDLRTSEVAWTEELYRTFGLDPDLPPPQYDEHKKLFTEPSWARLSAAVQQTVEQGIPYEFELETVRRDGTHGWLWVRGEPERADDGTIIELWGVTQDITERKNIEASLQRLALQRQLALNAAHLGWWQYDPLTRISTWDSGYKKIFGVTEDTKPNDEILEKIIHPDDLPGLWAKVVDALDPDTPATFDAEYRIIRPDGQLRWIEAHGIASFAGEGISRQAVELVGTVADVTERKLGELALKASEERLSTFIENAPVSLAMFDREMRYLSYSRRWLADFNIAEGSITGMCHYDLIPEHAPTMKDIQRRALGGEVYSAKGERFARADGTVQWLDWEVRPWHDSMGAIGGIVIFSEDVSELKRAEEERERLLSQLSQIQKIEAIGRLAGGVAHDYNNMLNVIIGYAEMAFDKIAPNDPLKEDLLEISRAAQRSADITRQLLAFARKQTITPQETDLNATIVIALKMLKRLIGENIDLVWRPGVNLWPVKVDPGQIDQVLTNLCLNARAAIADVGLIIIETSNVTLHESTARDQLDIPPGDYVRIVVEDTGTGMPPETLEKIFEPFFTTKGIGQGTGLGLASVYGIIKQHNGAVSVSSAVGEGTTFSIYLPRHKAAEGFLPSITLPSTAPRGTETVLLVEDELAILKITQRNLEKSGYTVLAANSPQQAIALAEQYSGDIDIIISDVIMPEMNGRVLVEKLMVSRPALKHLYMSGYTADLIAHHGVLDEGQNFIEKPFTREQLLAKLQNVLAAEGQGGAD